MLSISPLTYKVVAHQAVPNFALDDAVTWALEMIELGFDTESLLILAGLNQPLNYFETIEYLDKAITELGLQRKTNDEGVISYSSYYIRQIADGIGISSNLQAICDYTLSVDYHKAIYDFCLLLWAWDELIDLGQQWYWDADITLNDIEQVAIDRAKKWMQDNYLFYELNIS